MAVSTARLVLIRRATAPGSRPSGMFLRSGVWRSMSWAAASAFSSPEMKPLSPISRPRILSKVGDHVAFVDVGDREGHRCARQSDDQMAAQAVDMLLLGRAVAPCRFAP